jgi:hypothetical protein
VREVHKTKVKIHDVLCDAQCFSKLYNIDYKMNLCYNSNLAKAISMMGSYIQLFEILQVPALVVLEKQLLHNRQVETIEPIKLLPSAYGSHIRLRV